MFLHHAACCKKTLFSNNHSSMLCVRTKLYKIYGVLHSASMSCTKTCKRLEREHLLQSNAIHFRLRAAKVISSISHRHACDEEKMHACVKLQNTQVIIRLQNIVT